MKIKKILIIMLGIIMLISSNFVYATFKIDKASLYSKGECSPLFKISTNGNPMTISKIFYSYNGKEYPAYCVNKELDGVEKLGSYDVTIEEAVENQMIRRAIINGYPYKTPQELNVANEDEAFAATKQAIYCILYGFDANNYARYVPIGEAGERTLAAIKRIVNIAKTDTSTKPSSQITIKETGNWKVDDKDKNYVSKVFQVGAQANIKDYTITINNASNNELKVTDLNGNEITKTSEKQFKIMIPLRSLENDGTFEININGEVATMPILYGKSGNSTSQNYVLAGDIYEIGNGNAKVNYYKNRSKVKIIKKDNVTGRELEGIKFRILNENNEEIYTDLMTDKNGEIIIEGILPGKYYLEEVETKEGYKKLKERIEFEVKFNEELELEVMNEKIPEKTIKKLPVTGM